MASVLPAAMSSAGVPVPTRVSTRLFVFADKATFAPLMILSRAIVSVWTSVIVGAGVDVPLITRMSVACGEVRDGVQLPAVLNAPDPVWFQVYVACARAPVALKSNAPSPRASATTRRFQPEGRIDMGVPTVRSCKRRCRPRRFLNCLTRFEPRHPESARGWSLKGERGHRRVGKTSQELNRASLRSQVHLAGFSRVPGGLHA